MDYVATMLCIAVVPILGGYACAAGRRKVRGPMRSWRALVVALLAAAAWLTLSFATRQYSETDLPLWIAAEWFAHSGKWFVFCAAVLFALGMAVHAEPRPVPRFRAALCAVAVLMTLWITVWRTMPVYPFLQDSVHRDAAGCVRQSFDYTCGPASLMNATRILNIPTHHTERQAARYAGTTYEGTATRGLLRAAARMGLRVKACRVIPVDELNDSISPAIVFISTIPSVHHAILLVQVKPETVVCADPDFGMIEYSRKRFTQIWYGKTLQLAPAVEPATSSAGLP